MIKCVPAHDELGTCRISLISVTASAFSCNIRSMHDAMLAHLACLNDLILDQQVMHSLEHALQNTPEDVVRYGIRHMVLSLHCILLKFNP